jgi:RHS repeat-associated protein
VTDAASREYKYGYDAVDRILTVTDPTSVITQTNTYSPNGVLATVKDARGNITTYAPDGFDRIGKVTYPDATFEQLTFDSNSNVLTGRTRSGNTITNTYDVINRLLTKTPTGEGQVSYTYDLAGRLLTVADPVVSGDPSTGTFTFGYDTAGRVISEKTPDAKIMQYGLDTMNNLTKMTWPDGYYVTRNYDQLNRLTDIYLNGSTTSAAHFGFDQLSRRVSLAFQNGASVGYTYQLNNDLSGLTNTFVGSSVSQTFGYNNVHQITSRSISDSTYSWHPSAASSTTYGTGNNTNGYPTVGGTAYTYDGNGNLKTDGTWTYTYNTENQQTASSKTGTSTSSVIDPLLRQTQKTIGSAKTRFFYAGDTEVADYNGVSGALTNRYIFSDSGNEPLVSVTSAGALSYLHSDQVGSVIALSSPTGAISSKYTYSPFGESAVLSGTTFGYAGQRYDAENGLYYARARHYSPTIGRFMQTDPIGYGDGLNWNAYVNNDPLNGTDPSGLKSMQWSGGVSVNVNNTGEGGGDPCPGGDTGGGPIIIPTINPDDTINGGGGGDLSGQRGKPAPIFPDPFHGSAGVMGPGLGRLTDPLFSSAIVFTALGNLPVGGSMLTADMAAMVAARSAKGIANAGSSAEGAIGSSWIKSGSSGGVTAGKAFSNAVKDAAYAENPTRTCVYCKMEGTGNMVDHAIAKVKGGDATLSNAQITCSHCNLSKGARSYPVTPPPGYVGDWPPGHW